jgi:hypothetical protein
MCGILTDKPEEKSPFGRPGFTLEDNIKTDLKEIGCDGVNWNHVSGLGPVVAYYEHGNGPSGSVNSRSFLDQLCDD